MKRLVIFAGSISEGRLYKNELMKIVNDSVIMTSDLLLVGVHPDVVILCGTYAEKKDLQYTLNYINQILAIDGTIIKLDN